MPKTDPRKAASTEAAKASKPQALNTASAVQSEVVAVTQQLASDVSADAYAIGQQTAEYVNQQAFSAFLKGFNEGAAKADNPFSQLRQQLSASKPQPITLLAPPWFDEYGTARSLPTIRVILAPTIWQKAAVVLLSVGCILLILNLIAIAGGQSSSCTRTSSRCPQPISVSSAEMSIR